MDWEGTYEEQEMRRMEREAHSTYPDNDENYEEDLDYEEDEDEGKSEFEKYKQPKKLNLEDLEPNKIYYITFSDAGSKNKEGYFVDIGKQPIRDIRAKLIYIQEPQQIRYNVPISQSSSKWKLLPKDNKKLKDVFVFVSNSKLLVRDVPPRPVFIGKVGKSILRQGKDYIIPREAEDIMARASRRAYDKEYDDYLKQTKKELDERMARIFKPRTREDIYKNIDTLLQGTTGGKKHRKTRKTMSSLKNRISKGAKVPLRKTKRHQNKSKKTRKHFRK